ncbi:hypothetical protein HRbin26_01174 [bacterium HR26]|nr:hypothetical protein HRbin26_01174 [bacterium HR26]
MFLIELGEHIVQQEHRQLAGRPPERVDLGQLGRDDSQPLHPPRAESGELLARQRVGQVIAVRTDQRHATPELVVAQAMQRSLKALGYPGLGIRQAVEYHSLPERLGQRYRALIRQRQRQVAHCQLSEVATQGFGQTMDVAEPGDQHVGAMDHELLVPVGHLLLDRAAVARRLDRDLFEEAVALLQQADVPAQRPEVGLVDLRERDIEVAASDARRAQHQLEVLGREEHDLERSHHVDCPPR